METLTIVLIAVDVAFLIPFFIIGVQRKFLNTGFDISIAYAQFLGFLISINAPIRTGKTSFQSGLSHIFQILIQQEIIDYIDLVKKIYDHVDFNLVDHLIDESLKDFDLDKLTAEILSHFDNTKNMNMKKSLIYNFYSSKTTEKYILDYIFAYYVLNVRKNYVHSKTKFYSHITGNISYSYNINHTKIHEAFLLKDYAIYDYMVELVDEASDDIGANTYYNDVKEEDGDKDYRRKYGQIHQERNRMITTKQDVKDERKKFRALTQSNIWLPEKVTQRGTNRWIIKTIEIFFKIYSFFYRLILVYLPFKYHTWIKREDVDYETFKTYKWSSLNHLRRLSNKLLHLDWYLKSIAFNKYEVWDYPDEADVKKSSKEYYKKMVFYIPTKYCFGTYDTHSWKNIQKELLDHSTTTATESNWFFNAPYFETSKEDRSDKDDFSFE